MKSDPSGPVGVTEVAVPRMNGPGSGKTAWIAYAERAVAANQTLMAVIEEQRAVIQELEAEVKLLREQIASRKPKGGRERLPDETVNKIERGIEAGYSTRRIGELYRVSPMTVSRVRKRMAEREKLLN